MVLKTGLFGKHSLHNGKGVTGIFSPNSEIIGATASTTATAPGLTDNGSAYIFLFT